jgi:hypothetical protein
MTSVTTHYSALHKKVKEIFAVHNLDFPEIAVNTLAIPAPYGRRLYHQQDGTARLRGLFFPLSGRRDDNDRDRGRSSLIALV